MKKLLILVFITACGSGGFIEQKVENSSQGGSSQQQQTQPAEVQNTEDCLLFLELEGELFCELPSGDLRPIDDEVE